MLNQISEIAPAAAVLGLVAWGGLSYFVTSEELADRVSRVHYVPTCERTLEASISSNFQQIISKASRPSQAEQQSSMGGNYMTNLLGTYPEHQQFLDLITGGAMTQSVEQLQRSAREARKAREETVEVLKQRRADAIASAPDQCSCQVKAAFQENRNDWAIYAGTFGLIEQAGVTDFPSHMRANARMCSERVAL
jgi:hypothetical protein